MKEKKDYREIRNLVDKYYDGATTAFEVRRLQEFFSSCDRDMLSDDLADDCEFLRLQAHVAADIKLSECADPRAVERTRRFETFVDSLPDGAETPPVRKRVMGSVWKRIAACAAVLSVVLAGIWLLRNLTAPYTPTESETGTILIASAIPEPGKEMNHEHKEIPKSEESPEAGESARSLKSIGGRSHVNIKHTKHSAQSSVVAQVETATDSIVGACEITEPEEAAQLLAFVFRKIDSGIHTASAIGGEAQLAMSAITYDRDIITNKLNEIVEP